MAAESTYSRHCRALGPRPGLEHDRGDRRGRAPSGSPTSTRRSAAPCNTHRRIAQAAQSFPCTRIFISPNRCGPAFWSCFAARGPSRFTDGVAAAGKGRGVSSAARGYIRQDGDQREGPDGAGKWGGGSGGCAAARWVPNRSRCGVARSALTDGSPLSLQDLSTLDVSTLTPLSPEVISRQATINIGAKRERGGGLC